MTGYEGSCKMMKGYDRFIMTITDNDMSSVVMGGHNWSQEDMIDNDDNDDTEIIMS